MYSASGSARGVPDCRGVLKHLPEKVMTIAIVGGCAGGAQG
jgi:hypothetical protein